MRAASGNASALAVIQAKQEKKRIELERNEYKRVLSLISLGKDPMGQPLKKKDLQELASEALLYQTR